MTSADAAASPERMTCGSTNAAPSEEDAALESALDGYAPIFLASSVLSRRKSTAAMTPPTTGATM